MARQSNFPGMNSVGIPWFSVEIEEISPDREIAMCRGAMGKHYRVRMTPMRAKGMVPVVGERWLIDRSLGYWSFIAVQQRIVPVVTGSCEGNPAVISLLASLDEAGLIRNLTDPGQHPHSTHSH